MDILQAIQEHGYIISKPRNFVRILLEAILMGVLWGVMFYVIRKGLNTRNWKGNLEEKKLDFYWDAVYGGLAAGLSIILKGFLQVIVKSVI